MYRGEPSWGGCSRILLGHAIDAEISFDGQEPPPLSSATGPRGGAGKFGPARANMALRARSLHPLAADERKPFGRHTCALHCPVSRLKCRRRGSPIGGMSCIHGAGGLGKGTSLRGCRIANCTTLASPPRSAGRKSTSPAGAADLDPWKYETEPCAPFPRIPRAKGASRTSGRRGDCR
jgi:hypothetical protein